MQVLISEEYDWVRQTDYCRCSSKGSIVKEDSPTFFTPDILWVRKFWLVIHCWDICKTSLGVDSEVHSRVISSTRRLFSTTFFSVKVNLTCIP